jgi:thiol-disulfide isomerase/thioredoxin
MTESPRSRTGLPWQAYVAATVLALVAAGLVLFVAANRDDDEGGESATAESVELRPIDEVPDGDPLDIPFTDVDGTTRTIRDLLGDEPLVVNYFASWCPPCIAEMPDLQAVSEDMGDDVQFFGLAVTDRPEDATRIVERTGVTYPWSRDIKGDVAAAFGITTMPSTMFITPDGDVVHTQPGAVDQDKLRSLIAEHLAVAA